ncbi:hypothetical protein L3X38_039557 [Prunus dulcis]|uniref:UBC core domain-containing protein n=1 Tax=Prunus dulcis TaxID=3755 RepID=A0AAD4V8N6_PRUDU|nr:hypothetical protein L3X38_039557 [Prunus dulcis]
MELGFKPAMKRIRGIESKPSDRVGSTRIGQYQTESGSVTPGLISEAVRRILEEYMLIHSNPSDDFDCRMLERNPYEWQFGIRGASGTEFEGGIYHGRIQFPKEYPSEPPFFTLLTENGRFKTHNKIRIRRLNDWQPSWRVRDALDALIDEMPTYPDGELGSVEYNKEERRDLAIKSPAAEPQNMALLNASNGTGGSYVVSGNTFHATNSNGVGILDSMNAFSDEDHKLLPSWLKLFRWRKQN